MLNISVGILIAIILISVISLIITIALCPICYGHGYKNANTESAIGLIVFGIIFGITLFPGIFYIIGSIKHNKEFNENNEQNIVRLNERIKQLEETVNQNEPIKKFKGNFEQKHMSQNEK
ncbi:MAG: hypothetical protein FWC11_05805 [Firmicutes bacterium]|nr:hypothetical protein [Bacillota bacterium]MCL2256353.1 hypothetical protein [Bacillota bacterium]